MLSLYELNETYQQLVTLDADEEALKNILDAIEGDVKVKANNIGMVINTLKSEQLILETELKRLQAKLKASETKETNIKQYLSENLKAMGISKLDCELFKFSFRKSESVIIDNLELIPTAYVNESVVRTPDKKFIKASLEKGTIEGCHIETKHNLQVK
jgi:hypothetical protein